MSIKDWRVRIEDMIEALERIKTYVAGMTREAFIADTKTTDAVVRNLEIIGESANHLRANVTQRYPAIPWSHMAEMRHILVHEYHAVDPEIVWRTIHHDLPLLLPALTQVLHENPD